MLMARIKRMRVREYAVASEFIRMTDYIRLIERMGGTPPAALVHAAVDCRERLERELR
jgi:hypothetical protein